MKQFSGVALDLGHKNDWILCVFDVEHLLFHCNKMLPICFCSCFDDITCDGAKQDETQENKNANDEFCSVCCFQIQGILVVCMKCEC